MASKSKSFPPQTQARQPGREHQMRPLPDYAPRYPGSGRLKGKVALITGGDSGIGRAVTVLFAREGAKVAILYKEETTDATETAALVEAEGSEALLIRGDVGRKKLLREGGREDDRRHSAASTCSSTTRPSSMPRTTCRRSARSRSPDTFRTNIFGYIFMAQAALPHMKKGASIINTTSVTAYRGNETLVDYASTKGAIVAFTRSLSGQLAEKGIRVNGVAPGPIWTPLIPASFDAKKVATFGQHVPLGRAGQPNEVAPAFLFLASDDASYFTGQVLHPNGGEIING